MSTSQNNNAIVTIISKRVGAVQKYLKADKVEIPVQGNLLKPAALLKLYQSSLDARAAVAAGHATYQGALKARDEAEATRLAADESLKAWVLARFGAGSTEASGFGFVPRKQPAVSGRETRAAAVVQNKATREARGTVGKKAKLKIKGVVPTSTAPAAPATSRVRPVGSGGSRGAGRDSRRTGSSPRLVSLRLSCCSGRARSPLALAR